MENKPGIIEMLKIFIKEYSVNSLFFNQWFNK